MTLLQHERTVLQPSSPALLWSIQLFARSKCCADDEWKLHLACADRRWHCHTQQAQQLGATASHWHGHGLGFNWLHGRCARHRWPSTDSEWLQLLLAKQRVGHKLCHVDAIWTTQARSKHKIKVRLLVMWLASDVSAEALHFLFHWLLIRSQAARRMHASTLIQQAQWSRTCSRCNALQSACTPSASVNPCACALQWQRCAADLC
jgi:hypothetical protein